MKFLVGMHVHYVSGEHHFLAHVESIANQVAQTLNLIVSNTVAGKTQLLKQVPFDEDHKSNGTWHWIEGHWGVTE